jgi:murein DD-endopeptidase MepM/ murein hydrolase activator NlpD
LGAEETRAEAARAEAQQRRAEAASALEQLAQARSEQEAVRHALDLRIEAFEAEADQLAATEDELVALIAARASQPEEPPPTTTVPETTTTVAPVEPGPTTSTTDAPSTTAPTTSTPVPPDAPSFSWPAAGPVTSPFGWRWGQAHQGIDIGAWTGDPISASAGGTVILAGELGGYGYCTMIDHGRGYVTVYGHQSELLVSEGDQVSAGETIGLVGNTGDSTGPHLHFEIRVGGVPRDPMPYLP